LCFSPESPMWGSNSQIRPNILGSIPPAAAENAVDFQRSAAFKNGVHARAFAEVDSSRMITIIHRYIMGCVILTHLEISLCCDALSQLVAHCCQGLVCPWRYNDYNAVMLLVSRSWAGQVAY